MFKYFSITNKPSSNTRYQTCQPSGSPTCSSTAQRAFITGCGRAVPGVDQMKGKGALVDVDVIMEKLVETGIHNPKTGKPVSLDWARRNLGMGTLSIADLSTFSEAFDYKVNDGCKDVSEFEMAISAAKMALAEAGIEARDIDCILHVSGTVRFPGSKRSGMNDCMRGYTEALPGLRQDCLMQHQDSGCSGVVPPFRMAKAMLAGGDFKNILVVTSHASPRGQWREHTENNDLSEWINCVLFGDSATAFVLRGADSSSEVVHQTQSKICYEILDVNSITDTDFFIFQTYFDEKRCTHIGVLNPDAAKQVFSKKMFEWLKTQGLKISDLDALLMHQPNSFIVKKVKQYFAGDKVHDIADRYGNLLSGSLGNQFYEQLYQGKTKMRNGSMLAGFTLGAHAGNTYGGFIARACFAE